MAAGDIVVPYQSDFALVLHPAWGGTVPAVGAGDQVKLVEPGALIAPGQGYVDNLEMQGGVGQAAPSLGNVTPDGDIPLYARYGSKALAFEALLFGSEAVASIEEAAQVGTKSTFTFHPTLKPSAVAGEPKIGAFVTRVPGLGIMELDSFLTDAINWTWSNGQDFIRRNVSLRGRRMLDATNDSPVNTDTELDSITFNDEGGLIAPDEVEVRINAQTDAQLSSSHTIGVWSFDASISRGLGNDDPTDESAPYRILPVPTGRFGYESTLNLTLPDLNVFTYMGWHKKGTKLKAEIFCRGGNLPGSDGSNQYEYRILFPELISPGWDPNLQERYGQTIELRAHRAAASVAGMSDLNPHLIANRDDTSSTHVLTDDS